MRATRLVEVPTEDHLEDARVVWDYHQLNHDLQPADVGIGLGSHDLGVATYAAHLYLEGLFPRLVFTGANSPSTAARFPRGEAVEYREHAMRLGVPASAISIEPLATNTGENLAFTRDLLVGRREPVESVLLISKPYMERRAFATCQKLWPGVRVMCASEPIDLAGYIEGIGDPKLVVDMVVGDLQRVIEYPALGFAVEQHVPDDVHAAYQRLVDAGYTSRLTM